MIEVQCDVACDWRIRKREKDGCLGYCPTKNKTLTRVRGSNKVRSSAIAGSR